MIDLSRRAKHLASYVDAAKVAFQSIPLYSDLVSFETRKKVETDFRIIAENLRSPYAAQARLLRSFVSELDVPITDMRLAADQIVKSGPSLNLVEIRDHLISEIHKLEENSYSLLEDLNRYYGMETDGARLLPSDIAFTLATIVAPEPEPGPINVDFRDGKLALVPAPFVIDPANAESVRSATSHLIDSTDKFISLLLNSNLSDRRVIGDFEEVRDALIKGHDIVNLGLHLIDVDNLMLKYSEEISDYALQKFMGLKQKFRVFLNHFPQWISYVEVSDLQDITTDQVVLAQVAAVEVADYLEDKVSLADPELPKLIRYYAEFCNNPGAALRKVTYGLIRGLEGIVISVVNKLKEHVVDAATIGLISLIAAQINPLIATIPWLAWMLKLAVR